MSSQFLRLLLTPGRVQKLSWHVKANQRSTSLTSMWHAMSWNKTSASSVSWIS